MRLTPRQSEIAALLRTGMPNKLIARRMGISHFTVKAHLLTIYQKLGVSNRTEAALKLREAA